jgi:hypothetical protein
MHILLDLQIRPKCKKILNYKKIIIFYFNSSYLQQVDEFEYLL